eukprot:4613816-Pleurochrysis_carterae.AAC.1
MGPGVELEVWGLLRRDMGRPCLRGEVVELDVGALGVGDRLVRRLVVRDALAQVVERRFFVERRKIGRRAHLRISE